MARLFRGLLCRGLALVATNCFAADQKPQDIYKANCQGCHGPSGRASMVGKGMGARNFRDPAVLKVPVSMLAKIIANGKNQMPPYQGTLTAKEIKDLAKYIKDMK